MKKLKNSLSIIRKLLWEDKGFLLGFLFWSIVVTTICASWRVYFLDEITDAISNYWIARFLTSCLGNAIFLGAVFTISLWIGSGNSWLLSPLLGHDIEKWQGYTFIPFSSDVDAGVRNHVSRFDYHCRFLVFFPAKKLKLPGWIKIESCIVFIAFALMVTKDYFSTDMTGMSIVIDMFLIFIVIILGGTIGKNISESKFICNWPYAKKVVQIVDKYLCCGFGYDCVFVCPLQRLDKFSIKEFIKEYNIVSSQSGMGSALEC